MTALFALTPSLALLVSAAGEQQRVSNLLPFDVAICSPPKISLPAAPNAESVTGALRLLRPAVLECLVDPKSRAGADPVVTIKTAAVSGANLSAEGKACVEKAVAALA